MNMKLSLGFCDEQGVCAVAFSWLPALELITFWYLNVLASLIHWAAVSLLLTSCLPHSATLFLWGKKGTWEGNELSDQMCLGLNPSSAISEVAT